MSRYAKNDFYFLKIHFLTDFLKIFFDSVLIIRKFKIFWNVQEAVAIYL